MLWNNETGVVIGESGIFLGKNYVKLLFPAEKIIQVYNPTLDVVYEKGKDFSHVPGTDILYVNPNSKIPVLPENAQHPDPETAILYPNEGANAIEGGPDGKLLLFSAHNFYAGKQILIDYKAVDRTVFPDNPTLKSGQLPRFTGLLKVGKDVSITLIGDSISEGLNSTKKMNCPPYAPPYIELFAQWLEKQFSVSVDLRNKAISGTGCTHAFEIEDRWLAEPTDLLVIAYGMNDFARMDAGKYRMTVQRIIDKMRNAHPDTEYLLVTSMSGNTLWKRLPAGADALFAGELKKLESQTIAIADVNSFWNDVLKQKDFYDLTGNGVNHPNDFGYRIYAKVLLDLFR